MKKKFRLLLSAFLSVSLAMNSISASAAADGIGSGNTWYSEDAVVSEETVTATEELPLMINSVGGVSYVEESEPYVSEPEIRYEASTTDNIPCEWESYDVNKLAEAVASGDANGEWSGGTWEITGTKLTFSGTGDMDDFTSSSIVMAEWYAYAAVVTDVVFSNGITSIGDYTLYTFKNVKTITIGNTVTEIGSHAFYGCVSLTTVTDNSTDLSVIGDYAFYDCKLLTAYAIPSTVTVIDNYAFWGCKAIKTVTIPASVTSNLGTFAFYGCDSLATVVVKDGVTQINASSFAACSSLSTLTIPKTGLTSIGKEAFAGCTSLATVNGDSSCLDIPGSVTSVGESAFATCNQIQRVTFSNSIVKIDKKAFINCENLTSVDINGTSNLEIADEAFSACKKLTAVTMEGGVKSIGIKSFYASGISSISLSESLEKIGNYAFSETNLEEIEIPASVSEIGDYAFAKISTLKTLTISDSGRIDTFAKLGQYSFQNCTALTTLDLSGVSQYGYYVFSGCTALESATIGSNTYSMGTGTFQNCTSLSSIVIEEGAAVVAPQIAINCPLITSITIPSTVEVMDNAFYGHTPLETADVKAQKITTSAFNGCKNLSSVKITNATEFGASAFSYCTSITSIECPDTLVSIGNNAFSGCKAMTSIDLPSTLESIGLGCFLDCVLLNDVVLGDSVTAIPSQAFSGCSALSKITYSENVTSIGDYAFKNCTVLPDPFIPDGLKTLGIGAFQGCSAITKVTLPEGITILNSNVFMNCTSLEELTLEGKITSIGNYALSACAKLDGFEIQDTVTNIGSYAFDGCVLLDTAIPSAVKTIGNYAFKNCVKLGSECEIVLPPELTAVSSGVFYGCTSLTNLAIHNKITSIGAEAFYNCNNSKFNAVVIPESVTTVGNSAFENCTGLLSVAFNTAAISEEKTSGCTSIGMKAFMNCSNIANVTLPSTLTTISGYAFSNCSALESINFPSKLTTLGNDAFNGCSKLKTAVLAATGITTVSTNVFRYCESLETVTLPEKVTSISGNCFEGCKALESITIPGKVTSVGPSAFKGCEKLTFVIIPKLVGSLGASAFEGCTDLETVILLSTTVTPGSNCFAGCPDITVYCYDTAKNAITFLENAKIPYEFLTGSDGSYLVLLKDLVGVVGVASGDVAEIVAYAASESAITYEWHYKNPGDSEFTKSNITGDTYSVVFSDAIDGQEVYCIISSRSAQDENVTNKITSNTVSIRSKIKPVMISATAGRGQVALEWEAVEGATKYRVQRTDGTSWTSIAYPATTTYVDKNVTSGTTYKYRVLAYVNNTWSAYSDYLSATPVDDTIPQNVKATAGDKKVTLSWTKVTGATKYRVQRLNGTSWSTVNYPTATSYTDTGLTNGTTYKYRVLAYVDGAWGTASAAVSATPKASVIPQNVKATAGDKQITLSWTAVTGATKYRVQRLNGTSWSTVKYPTTTSYTDTGLTNGTTYKYRVLAYVNNVWGTASATVSATPKVTTTPQDVKATAGDKKVTITWTKVTGATKYRVQRTTGSSWSTVNYPATNSYTDTGLTNGTTYKYRVLAYVNNVWSTASAVVSATPKASVIPQNVKATAGDKKVTLSWTAVSGATKYRVQRLNGTTWSTVKYPTTNSYTDTGLTKGTTYKYRVIAYVNNAWGTASATVSATPKASIIPQNVKATAGSGKVTITWTAVSGATKYRLQRATTSSWSTINYPTTNSYTDTDVTNGTTYKYRVLAYVNGAWSAASASVSATPDSSVLAPTNVRTVVGGGYVSISWSAVTGATQYKVERSTNIGADWSLFKTVTTTSCVDTTIVSGTTYNYRVYALVDGEWSPASATVTITAK